MFTEVVQANYVDGYRIAVLFNDGVKKTWISRTC